MIRLRIPGGQTSGQVLRRLTELAPAYGNGVVQLTSRAGLQLRGLPDPLPADLVEAIVATGVLPAPSHERVRNIVASPLTGLSGGLADLRPLIADLESALIADPALAELPGRFLFVLDDGRGDVAGLNFDLAYQATGPDTGLLLVGSPGVGSPGIGSPGAGSPSVGSLSVGSCSVGLSVSAAQAVPTLLALAGRFVTARAASGAWRVAELPDWIESLGLSRVPATIGRPSVPLGRVGSAASVAVPLGQLRATHIAVIDELVGGGPVVITPWRGLILPRSADQLDRLEDAGLVVDDTSSWANISACVGAPACGRARIDTKAVAELLVGSKVPIRRLHISGCERRCGAPAGEHLDLVAPRPDDALQVVRQTSVSVNTVR